jgi:hypothetical protein
MNPLVGGHSRSECYGSERSKPAAQATSVRSFSSCSDLRSVLLLERRSNAKISSFQAERGDFMYENYGTTATPSRRI